MRRLSGNPGIQCRDLAKAAQVARFLTVLRIKIGLHKIPSHAGTDGTTAHAEDIHVVVLDTLLRGEVIMDQAGSDTLRLVRADRGPYPTAADCNTTLNLTGHNRPCKGSDIVGIIVVRGELMGSEIDHFMAGSLELGNEFFLEFESAVIGGKSYAHGSNSSFAPDENKGEERPQIGLSRGADVGSTPRMYLGVHQMKA